VRSAIAAVSWFRFLVPIIVAVQIAACGGRPEIIWSQESRSPDGRWLAIAETQSVSGPGNNYFGTVVSLQRSDSSERQTILAFSQNDLTRAKLAHNHPSVSWSSPSQLNVVFARLPEFDAIATRYDGVSIAVSAQSDAPIKEENYASRGN
jgi:hypothetical protein